MGLLDDIEKPYSWELDFYKKNNIPFWELKPNEKTKDLGRIYKAEDGSYIKAIVKSYPALFWEFEIFCAENKTITKTSTGSGGLMNYFETMKLIAEGMIVVDSIN
jgi:hypothetical protein